jgi:hypothetical protein
MPAILELALLTQSFEKNKKLTQWVQFCSFHFPLQARRILCQRLISPIPKSGFGLVKIWDIFGLNRFSLVQVGVRRAMEQ